jgi:hypothetical protein
LGTRLPFRSISAVYNLPCRGPRVLTLTPPRRSHSPNGQTVTRGASVPTKTTSSRASLLPWSIAHNTRFASSTTGERYCGIELLKASAERCRYIWSPSGGFSFLAFATCPPFVCNHVERTYDRANPARGLVSTILSPPWSGSDYIHGLYRLGRIYRPASLPTRRRITRYPLTTARAPICRRPPQCRRSTRLSRKSRPTQITGGRKEGGHEGRPDLAWR